MMAAASKVIGQSSYVTEEGAAEDMSALLWQLGSDIQLASNRIKVWPGGGFYTIHVVRGVSTQEHTRGLTLGSDCAIHVVRGVLTQEHTRGVLTLFNVSN